MPRNQQHYEILDGLRGVAALAVAVLHLRNIVTPDAKQWFLPHAYLAVDFFFCLSGFIVSHAYDMHLRESMTPREFMIRRCVRLHPMIVIGTLVGLFLYCWSPFRPGAGISVGWRTMLILVLALSTLPYPAVPGRLSLTHSLNGPIWSLFMEYLANIAFALGLYRTPLRTLVWLALVCGCLTLACAAAEGSLDRGWSYNHDWGGIVRVSYPFLAGLILHRVLSRLPALRVGFWPLAALMLLAMELPVNQLAGGTHDTWANGLYDAAVVLVVFPAIIVAGTHHDPRRLTLRTCRVLGKLSYPLYILQQPFNDLLADYVHREHPGLNLRIELALALITTLILVALAMGRWYDEPLRRWLNRRLLSPRSPDQSPIAAPSRGSVTTFS